MKPVRPVIRFFNLGFWICLGFSISNLGFFSASGQEAGTFTLARLKYEGGGDWYNDPDILPNLAAEVNRRTNIRCAEREAVVDVNDDGIFSYPFVFMTGHGNISFSDDEVKRLRLYLKNGGFLYADDDYGMDESFRRELKKVFPENELVELPFDHPLYRAVFDFPNGPPKIHEHYPGAPQGFGIFYRSRLVVYYTYNANISDGWTEAHDDPPDIRDAAFRMGINIIAFSLTR